MAVLIDARPLQNDHAVRGVGMLVRNLLRELAKLDQQQDCQVLTLQRDSLVPLPQERQLESFRLPVQRLNWMLDQLLIPRLLQKGRFDVFFATDFNSYIRPRRGAGQVAIAYDLIPFLFPETMAELPLEARMRVRFNFGNLGTSRLILAISKATKKDLTRSLGVPPEKIRVIYPGIDHLLFNVGNAQKPVDPRYQLPDRYFLYVGDPEWRKNLRGVLEALAGLPEQVKLLVVGKRAPTDLQLKRWLDETSTGHRVILPGFVPDEDLPALYGHALGFVFPSRYEGFGLPVAEALACGCPVVTAANSSLPEVAGDAALYVDPERPEEIRESMTRLLNDAALRESLMTSGLLQVQKFTWDKAARETLAALLEGIQKC